MSELDFFGHWFYFFLFLGNMLISAKDYRGWAFRFAGEVGWIGIGAILGMTSIVLWGMAFMAWDIFSFLKWKKEHVEDKPEELAALEFIRKIEEFENGKDQTVKRQSKGKALATKRRKPSKKRVPVAPRRRSVKADGKRRGRPNDVPRSAKKSRR